MSRVMDCSKHSTLSVSTRIFSPGCRVFCRTVPHAMRKAHSPLLSV
jgi:hypothetical protein